MVYRDKFGFRFIVDEVILGEEVKIVFSVGNFVEDNGNCFIGYVIDVILYK